MKNKLKFIATSLAIIAIMSSCAGYQSIAGTTADYQGGPGISFNVFYSNLSPYGQWINYGGYGQAWIPSVGNGFVPYSTNGQWVYSSYGWTWVSDYSWGWAPFHYGRWIYDDYYGWIWIPGSEWAPAWVAWRNSPDYYGWAPLGPGVSIGINIGIPAANWVFVPRNYFGRSDAYRYYVPRRRNVTIINNTTVINNVNIYNNQRYFSGPSRRDVQMATNRNIRPVRIFNSNEAGVSRVSNDRLTIYRPTVERITTNRAPVRSDAVNTMPSGGENRPSRVFNGNTPNNNNREVFQNGFPMDNTRPDNNIRPNPNQRIIENGGQRGNNRPGRTFTPAERVNPQDRAVFENRQTRPAPERTMEQQRPQQAENRPERTFNNQRTEVRRPEPRQMQRVEMRAPSQNNGRQVEVRQNERESDHSRPTRER